MSMTALAVLASVMVLCGEFRSAVLLLGGICGTLLVRM